MYHDTFSTIYSKAPREIATERNICQEKSMFQLFLTLNFSFDILYNVYFIDEV